MAGGPAGTSIPTVAGVRSGTLVLLSSLILLPLLVKSPLLLGFLDANPMHAWANLSPRMPRPYLWGRPTIDSNIGYTSHALGALAGRQLLAGSAVWWNPYEGLGTPLAGEMQSAALFPPTLLLLMPNGQLLEHLLFQIASGLATYALLRRLGAGRAGAWLAGVTFAFNGAFAWLANAVINPVCFLPLVVLGVELIASSRRWGGVLVALGLAGSLYAGFPEVAYLNGLLIGVWTVVRATTMRRIVARRFVIEVTLFSVCGLLLAAPLLAAFGDYLRDADVGLHGSEAIAGGSLEARHGVLLFLPYLTGTLFSQPAFWGTTGGYAGLSLSVLALAGSMGRQQRRLRGWLAGWVIVSLGATFGVPPFLSLFHLLPLTRVAALYRYLDSSWLFALSILAGLAIDDLASGRENVARIRTALGLVALTACALGLLGWTQGVQFGGVVGSGICAGQALVLALLCTAVYARRLQRTRSQLALIVVASAAEMIALFAVPILSYPRSIDVETGGVRFLRKNLGLQRFVTLGPIGPNYGSFFGIAEVNHNDLPVPHDWVAYAGRHLDRHVDPILLSPSSPSALLAHLPQYAAIGTRFVVAPADKPLPNLPLRYADRVMRIYELPGVRPYLDVPFCTVAPGARTEVELMCARPSRLVRLELLMPGWSVSVNGREAPLLRTGEVFQAVDVPAGRVHVSFRFRPPHLSIALILGGLGLALLLVGVAWVGGLSRFPFSSRRSDVTTGGGGVYASGLAARSS